MPYKGEIFVYGFCLKYTKILGKSNIWCWRARSARSAVEICPIQSLAISHLGLYQVLKMSTLLR